MFLLIHSYANTSTQAAAAASALAFSPLLALVQHLCVQSPDRADVRGHVASAVITIIQHMRTTTTATAATGTSTAATASTTATDGGGSSSITAATVRSGSSVSERTRCLRFLARAAKSPKLAHRYFNDLKLQCL
jgi:hypothetical protein